MPKRVDLNKILVIGAGPIVIGQACEFDYSGTQACKALKDEGYFVILINSNPATIMTDENLAHRTYIEPITAEFVEKIIQKERPDAILPTVGGQTALNCALELWKNGILDKYNVTLIGAAPDAIDKAENRERFNQAMHSIGLEVAKNVVVNSMEQALKALDFVGLPAVIRPSFTLGGSGGGIAYSKEEFIKIVSYGLSISPTHEVLIDESLLGWKEYEMEVVRDVNDNAIIICSIENIDPMGVHTGDSITVAPALTLTDKEYQYMRNASIAVLRVIGVETGGSNVQFAINPADGRMIVIEMNPRVSRSSALASKATGFPIAKIAAKLAIGYTLDELKNNITRFTPAAFEPTLDYVVTKIPRFAFEKFGVSNNILTTSMKSVGEVMAIGRNFAESLQKALRSLDIGLTGLNSPKNDQLLIAATLEQKQAFLRRQLTLATPERLLYIAEALRCEIPTDEVSKLTNYTPWFVEQISHIVGLENLIKATPTLINERMFLVSLKKMGFADNRIAELANVAENYILEKRQHYKIHPVYKTIDTCAGEFVSYTPYLYSCYEDDGITCGECESNVADRDKVIILGGGPNRIGQGIEFDYACCHVALEMKRLGVEAIMINCNPETVSTDYDTSDKLYFDPLYHEDVLEIIHNEQRHGNLLGVIVQFGGQTPLKLAHYLDRVGIKILGTSLDSIDLAEERGRFQEFLTKLNILQPQNGLCYSLDSVEAILSKADIDGWEDESILRGYLKKIGVKKDTYDKLLS
ncbi:MAG: carbamoyl-phosphate synthase large subunit, partial [Burkholderiales bacterium]|nr:carbamoyl-phosphate synthase large subunit [Burkholderiales bacterium]